MSLTGTTMDKRTNKCSNCKQTGHNARTCATRMVIPIDLQHLKAELLSKIEHIDAMILEMTRGTWPRLPSRPAPAEEEEEEEAEPEDDGDRICVDCDCHFQEDAVNMEAGWHSTKCPGCSGNAEPDSEEEEEAEEEV
jgi:hypothetical protein